ncbi:MAG: preprotein translocase subunit YajC [Clostridia bacterium]|nr:preprotein translocase subunit YajC [Clostridia bacterium]
MFQFLLTGTTAPGNNGGNPDPWPTIIMLVVFVLLMIWMFSSNKKRRKEEANMLNSLEVGDEITTIGGIIGEIVSMKEDTITIETSKAGTKIRFLKTAVRSVDVRAADKRAPQQPEEETDK